MKIHIGSDVGLTEKMVRESALFQAWAGRAGEVNYHQIRVVAADVWGGHVQKLMLAVLIEGESWSHYFTLRSDTVDVVTVITDNERSVLAFTEQYRPAAGARVMANVAGGIEFGEGPLEAAGRELPEELGLDASIKPQLELLIPQPVLATPGLTNERVYMVRAVIELPAQAYDELVDQLDGKHTGVAAENESIIVRLQPPDKARAFITQQANPDAKTLLGLQLAGF